MPDLVALARGPGPAQRVLAGFLAGMLAPYPDRAEQSRQLFDHAFAQGHLLGHVDIDPLFVGFALFAAVKFDDLARASALAEELLAQSRSRGSVAGVAIGICLRIAIRARQADLRGAEADIRTLIEITVDHGMTFVIPQGLYWGAEALIERSELADVAALLSGIDLDPGIDRTPAQRDRVPLAFCARTGGRQRRPGRSPATRRGTARRRQTPWTPKCAGYRASHARRHRGR